MRRCLNGTVVCQLVILAGCLVLPALAWGQTNPGIAGTVRDTSGAVLPGVTVEAASPALIEKVRIAVTDTEGQYRILELRPGAYSVTFSLPGFTTLRRDGIALTSGLTATVNVELSLGSLEETITVSGAAPIVDVQNSASASVLTTEVLDTLPVARSLQGFGAVTVGSVTTTNARTRDVGGNAGDWSGRMFVHGVVDFANWFGVEGLPTTSILRDGSRRQEVNYAGLQEVVLNTGAPMAEWRSGGMSMSVVPKEGGNTFRGVLFADYTGADLQSSNLDDALRARGVSASNVTKIVSDVYGGLGGPIVQDKLWFYTAHRWKAAAQELAGVYYNKLQGQSPFPAVSTTLFYEPDFNRAAYSTAPARQYYHERFTWQAAAKHKITLTLSDEDNCFCVPRAGRDPAASPWQRTGQRNLQPAWTYAATNRFLVEAGFNHRWEIHNYSPENFTRQAVEHLGDVAKTDRAMFEQSLGLWYSSYVGGANPALGVGGWQTDYGHTDASNIWSARAAVSYVSGSHAFKTGVSNQSGWANFGPGIPNFPEAYQLRDRVPTGLWQVASPGFGQAAVKAEIGVFAQDQWTTGKMTVNLGIRFDYFNAYAKAVIRPAGPYTPEFNFPEVPNLPNWKDINPRAGVVYDLFGNGRTALKASFGRYVSGAATRIAQEMQPSDQVTGTVFRTWADANRDFVPDCNLKSPLANGECGPMANQLFGTSVSTRRYAEDYLNGWGQRGYNLQGSVSVQHELKRGFALNAGYYRTVNRNLEITDNLAVTPADYDPFCITAPVNSKLPGGGGNQICGLYNIKPEKFGLVDSLVRASEDVTESYHGVDLSTTVRFGQGGMFFGGLSLAETTRNNCFVVDTPDQRFCKTLDSLSQIKMAGAYPLAWGLQASATFQNLPGIDQLANFVVGNAQIVSSLGRNLGSCRGAATCNGTVTVPLIAAGAQREPRQNQLDVKLSKQVLMGRVRIEPKFEVFNALNANDAQEVNPAYGSTWPLVNAALAGRLFKVGAQVNF